MLSSEGPAAVTSRNHETQGFSDTMIKTLRRSNFRGEGLVSPHSVRRTTVHLAGKDLQHEHLAVGHTTAEVHSREQSGREASL